MLIRMEDAAPITPANPAQTFLFLISQGNTDLRLDPVRFLNNLIDFARKAPEPLSFTTAMEADIFWAAAEVDRLRFSKRNERIHALFAQSSDDTMVRRVGIALGLHGVYQLRPASEVKNTPPRHPPRVVDDYLNP